MNKVIDVFTSLGLAIVSAVQDALFKVVLSQARQLLFYFLEVLRFEESFTNDFAGVVTNDLGILQQKKNLLKCYYP